MKLSRRTNTIILWLISIGLLVSMVIAFTPTLNGLFGSGLGGNGDSSAVALLVNGEPVTELELARAEQSLPFSGALEGQAAEDVDLLIADNLITSQVLEEAASDIRVTGAEVREAVNEWRQQQGVAGSSNDRDYLNLVSRFGYTDQSFREFWRGQLRQEQYREQITDGVTVTDDEVQAYFDLNQEAYQTEARIRARQIVVDDLAVAEDLLAEAEAGADFAELAAENSLELAERSGALGAAEGETEPQPVGRPALPTAVASAAFGIGGEGLTEVVESGGRYYIISVEELVEPSTRPFGEVADEVREDALEAKEQEVLEDHFEELLDAAEVTVPEGSPASYNDAAVATVGEREILNSELVRTVYSDPQISQTLSPETAQVITDLFKPSYLERLIESELAYQGAQALDATFIGTRAQVARSALEYVSRDAEATEAELESYYQDNIARFTIPESALLTQINFETLGAARAFRAALLDGADLTEAAEAEGGVVSDLGTVGPGSLPAELDAAVFSGDTLDPLPDSEDGISDVLVLSEPVVAEEAEDGAEATEETPEDGAAASEDDEDAEDEAEDTAAADDATDEPEAGDADTPETETAEPETAEPETTQPETTQTYVLLVGSRTAEEVQPLGEVRTQVEDAVLLEKRNELQTEWLDGLRETIMVENSLAEAEPAEFETEPLEDTGEATEDAASGTEDAADEDAEPAENAEPEDGSESDASEEAEATDTEDADAEETEDDSSSN